MTYCSTNILMYSFLWEFPHNPSAFWVQLNVCIMLLMFQLILSCFIKSSKSTIQFYCDHNCKCRVQLLSKSRMKHQINHSEVINGITYKIIDGNYAQGCVDFFFDVFLKDEPLQKSYGSLTERWALWLFFNRHDIFSVTFINIPSRHPNLVSNIEAVIADGVSVMAMNSNDDIIGIRLSCTETK